MNKIIVFLCFGLLCACSTTQVSNTPEGMRQQAEKELNRMDKQSRKAAEAFIDSLQSQQAYQALEAREFVLEADRVGFRRGAFAYVTGNTNFISLHGNEATIQLAFNGPHPGPNGIGGITVEGRTTNVEMKTDKKGNVTFSMMVQGTTVSAQVTLRMNKGTNRCTAVVTPTFSGNRITLTGTLYPESESNIFKGRTRY